MLDVSDLRKKLNYDPATGEFTWAYSRGPIKIGQAAGRILKDGYRSIQFNGREWMAHCLAWAYVYGSLPSEQIDHRNLIKDDNRIGNLRAGNQVQQQGNTQVSCRNKSGLKGVRWYPERQRWRAEIRINGRSVYLGDHRTKEDAAAAYAQAALRQFGDFARLL